jgi:DNA-binding NarL/FixJ family response regulator
MQAEFVQTPFAVGAYRSTAREVGTRYRKAMSGVARKPFPPRAQALTDQERRVLDLLCTEGMSNAELGHELAITTDTVKRHIANLMEKTGYSTRLEMVVRTLQKRAVQPHVELLNTGVLLQSEPEFHRQTH